MSVPVLLLIAPTGQVGWELARTLLPHGKLVTCTREQLDLGRPEHIGGVVDAIRPTVIVNAGAYTAVDGAETEPDLAMRINADAPHELALAARRQDALLVHYSTDYVFDGSGQRAFGETDATGPLGSYGRSKLAGESAIRGSGCDYLIFRTSWVYASRGKNFLRTMLKLAAEREALRVVDDQIGAPTWARLIAEVTSLALHQDLQARQAGRFSSDLLHLTAAGETSWHGFAAAIIESARALGMDLGCRSVQPIPTRDYPLPAPRPLNSRLACRRLELRYGLALPGWRECMDAVLREIAVRETV
jgi:dTDP-4-dehydrorhamnose reductase